MGCVIDHLSRDHELRVLRDFVDLRGTRHRAGDRGVLRDMDLDWNTREISLQWEHDGSTQTLWFDLGAKEGPRSGAMREYFEVGARVPRPEDTPAGRKVARVGHRRLPPDLREVQSELITSPSSYAAALQRVWALAARRRFDEAEDQLRAMAEFPDGSGYSLQQLAEDVAELALAHVDDEEADVYRWLREQARNYCYSFGAGATSGGEGAVRGQWIRQVEARLPER